MLTAQHARSADAETEPRPCAMSRVQTPSCGWWWPPATSWQLGARAIA